MACANMEGGLREDFSQTDFGTIIMHWCKRYLECEIFVFLVWDTATIFLFKAVGFNVYGWERR